MSSQGSPLGNLVVRVEGDSSPLEESLHKMEGSVAGFVEHVGTATAGLAAAFGLALLGEQAFEAAEKFEQATFTIQRATGATGEKLEHLEETFKNVYARTGQSADAVAGSLAQLSIRTGLVGEELEKLAITNLRLTKVMGGDLKSNIEQTQKLFTQWGVTVEEQPVKLDALTVASQKTGVNFQTLTGEMTTAGPVLRNLGFDFEQSAALLAKFDQSGLGTQRIIASLGQTLSVLSKRFQDPEVELRNLITRMQAAPTTMNALQLAMADGVGKKGALFLADAVHQGAFAVDDLVKEMRDGKGTVDDLADKTKSLGDRWKVFQHVLEEALLPLGKPLIIALTDGADKAKALVKEIQGAVDWFEKLPTPVKAAAAVLVALPIGIELAVSAFEKLMALQVITWFKGLITLVPQVTGYLIGMEGPLSLGATRLLAFGTAALGAGAAFAGWKFGEWLERNIPLVAEFEQKLSELVEKVFPHMRDGINGVGDSEAELRTNTDKLAEKMRKMGIDIETGPNESVHQYRARVLEAADANKDLIKGFEEHAKKVEEVKKAHGSAHPILQKSTQIFTDMQTSLEKLNVSKFSSNIAVAVANVYQMLAAHQAWGKQIEYVTADINQSNDALALQGDALLQQVTAMQNIAAVPLPAWYNDTTAGIYTADDAFKTLNLTADSTIDKQIEMVYQALAFVSAMYEVGAATEEEMNRASEAARKALETLSDSYDGATTKITKSSQTMGQQITKVIGNDLSKAIGDIVFQTGKIGDAFVKLGKDVVDIVLNHIIGAALKPLLSSLDQVLAKIPGLGSVFEGAASGAGSAAGGAASSGGGAASGVGSALMGGLAGWVNVGVSALSGIVQGVEGARTNNLLGEIEISTRKAWTALGEGDTSIAGWTHQTVMALSGMQQTLWEMRGDFGQVVDNLQQILAQIKTVAKMSASVVSGNAGGNINFNAGSIVVQGADDPNATAHAIVRAIPRIMKSRSSAFITQPAF